MDEELEGKSNIIIKLLQNNNIKFDIYEHEPIFLFFFAEKVSKKLGFTGTESKSLFLKSKNGKYYIYFTIQGEKVGFKKLKEILGEKILICEAQEMTKIIGCYPGCVSPFGHNSDITIILDRVVLKQDRIIFSPGVPNKTIVINTVNLKTIFSLIDNSIVYIN